MTNCKYCGHPAVLEGDGIHEERGWVCTAHCNQDIHDCPYDDTALKVTGVNELTCGTCGRIYDKQGILKIGDPLLSEDEMLSVFKSCDASDSLDPFFELDGVHALASIARIINQKTGELDRRIPFNAHFRHESLYDTFFDALGVGLWIR